MDNWLLTVVVGLISASVPTVILTMLTRKRDQAKFNLEKGTAEASIFDSVSGRLNTLLDSAEKRYKDQGIELAEALRRIKALEDDSEKEKKQNRTLNRKLDKLRNLLRSYTTRTGNPLTVEEQAVFDETDPEWVDDHD